MVPKQKKNVNLKVLTLISRINESNKLMNHISCKCKCEFDGKKYHSKEIWKKNKRLCKCKNQDANVCKGYTRRPVRFPCENVKYFGSLVHSSDICDEVIETTKRILTNIARKTVL